MNFIKDNIGIILIIWLICNLISFIMFAVDKKKAEKQKWRIPEASLILSAVFGIIGGFCGMYIIRHKTKKPKFYISLPAIAIAEATLIILLIAKF